MIKLLNTVADTLLQVAGFAIFVVFTGALGLLVYAVLKTLLPLEGTL